MRKVRIFFKKFFFQIMDSKILFLRPLDFPDNAKTYVLHEELPPVINELSVTLRLNLQSHNTDWVNIFQKGMRRKGNNF